MQTLYERKYNVDNEPSILVNLQCLKEANATEMVNREWDGVTFGICDFPFTPIVDGTFLPAGPDKLLASGRFQPAQVLLGANRNEGIYFIIYYLTEHFKLMENVSMFLCKNRQTTNGIKIYKKNR